jgi:DNA-binding transcriptional ArsR family regulator
MTDPLTALLSTVARVRLVRMFVFNPSLEVSMSEVLRRAKLSQRAARTELNQLERAGVIKKKFIFEQVPGKAKRRRVVGFSLNRACPIVVPLQTFLFETAPINAKTLQRHLRGVGKIQVLVAAGAFLREFERRLDVLVAVEKLHAPKVEAAIRNLEAELGVSIKYAAFTTDDLIYRIGMHDKLIRDIFDYPHELIVDKVNVRDQVRRR